MASLLRIGAAPARNQHSLTVAALLEISRNRVVIICVIRIAIGIIIFITLFTICFFSFDGLACDDAGSCDEVAEALFEWA